VPVPPGRSEEKRSVVSDQLDISDLDLSPLFVEPPVTGIFATFLPWINLVLGVIILLILVLK